MVVAGLVAAPAGAFLDRLGNTIANTSTASPTAQLAGAPQTAQLLASPQDPSINDPGTLAKLGSPTSPEEDLSAALAQIGSTTDTATAGKARQLALDILEGNAIPGKPYSGLPLLNWNVPARVQTVPAGGTVTIREVRFGQHVLTDTWLLQFADPTQPFSITYRVSELGAGTIGGQLAPTPIISDGGPIGGLHSVVEPLIVPNQLTGTTIVSTRFAPNGAQENTREVTQDVTVRMPAPKFVTAVLDPNLMAGHESMATVMPATPDRMAAAQAAFGFTGLAPTPAQKLASIALLGDASPEKQIWRDLMTLDPSNAAARTAAATAGAPRMAQMRVRQHLPAGISPVAGADVTVALVNDEAYVSTAATHVTSGTPLKVGVVNGDGFARTISATDLHSRNAVFGAGNWGEFRQSPLALGSAANLAPGASALYSLTMGADSFALWLGDPDRGDQASTFVNLLHGPMRQTIQIGAAPTAPEGGVADSAGNVWLALHGLDNIERIGAATDLTKATADVFQIPGGNHDNTSVAPVLGPRALTLDAKGIVWATLAEGNAIARLDPSKTKAGTTNGVSVLPLHPCAQGGCGLQFPPPADTAAPSRFPDRLDTAADAAGNTIVWFTEQGAGAVGMLKVDPAGNVLDSQDISCDCDRPTGIAVAGSAVWFAERGSNRIGRITATSGSPVVDHFNIPSSALVEDPLHASGFQSSAPDGVAVDKAGRVWFAERSTGKVAFLDPALAQSNTKKGFTEFALPGNDFGEANNPAGITIDTAGTVFYVNAMGDRVGSVTAAGVGPVWAARDRHNQLSLPIVDPQGNLYFSETIGSALTRLSGVAVRTAPDPAPATSPAPSPAPATNPAPSTSPAPATNPAPAANPSPTPGGQSGDPVGPAITSTTPAAKPAATPAPATPAKPAATTKANASTVKKGTATAKATTKAAAKPAATSEAKVLGSTIQRTASNASRPLVTQPADFQHAKKHGSLRLILLVVGALLLILNAIGAFRVPLLTRSTTSKG
jgi:streptogramin lyase